MTPVEQLALAVQAAVLDRLEQQLVAVERAIVPVAASGFAAEDGSVEDGRRDAESSARPGMSAAPAEQAPRSEGSPRGSRRGDAPAGGDGWTTVFMADEERAPEERRAGVPARVRQAPDRWSAPMQPRTREQVAGREGAPEATAGRAGEAASTGEPAPPVGEPADDRWARPLRPATPGRREPSRTTATGDGARATGDGARATGDGARATGDGARATGDGARATGAEVATTDGGAATRGSSRVSWTATGSAAATDEGLVTVAGVAGRGEPTGALGPVRRAGPTGAPGLASTREPPRAGAPLATASEAVSAAAPRLAPVAAGRPGDRSLDARAAVRDEGPRLVAPAHELADGSMMRRPLVGEGEPSRQPATPLGRALTPRPFAERDAGAVDEPGLLDQEFDALSRLEERMADVLERVLLEIGVEP